MDAESHGGRITHAYTVRYYYSDLLYKEKTKMKVSLFPNKKVRVYTDITQQIRKGKQQNQKGIHQVQKETQQIRRKHNKIRRKHNKIRRDNNIIRREHNTSEGNTTHQKGT